MVMLSFRSRTLLVTVFSPLHHGVHFLCVEHWFRVWCCPFLITRRSFRNKLGVRLTRGKPIRNPFR